ncbi:unnamed protein product [Caenorhabditis angaria]|uniref:CHK kinase-like domain-containing protein n=1 Tax=Caenorhabditis angaria TaxID=860376 RepID=A0A9P1INH2_9PELO|nr:unnamed protein product [Caenorhabditis angaria]
MSLHEEASGLFGTHVTWEDIEDEVRLSLGTEARFGANKKATNIGDMKGFMSRIALIEADWTPESQNLPKKFVVKLVSQLAFIEISSWSQIDLSEEKMRIFDGMLSNCHNQEVGTYQLFLELEKENQENGSQIPPIIKIYSTRKISAENPLKGFIVTEFVEDLKPLSIFDSLEISQIIPVIQGIARFSALPLKLPENRLEFAGKSDFFAKSYAEFSDEKTRENSYFCMRKSFPEEFRVEVEELIEVYRKYTTPEMIRRIEKIPEICGFAPQLVHGDLWSGNLMFSKNLEFRAIIDWQAVSFGSPAQDLCRLFITILSAKKRRANLDFLLRTFYEELIRSLKISGVKVPYTFEQLKKNYRLMFPICTILVLPTMISYSEVIGLREDENREIVKNSAIEKAVGMMEDVLKAHSDNLIDFPQFFE